MVKRMTMRFSSADDTHVVLVFHDGSTCDITRWLGVFLERGTLGEGGTSDAVEVATVTISGTPPVFFSDDVEISLATGLALVSTGAAAVLTDGILAEAAS
jgi:hypothetical protein